MPRTTRERNPSGSQKYSAKEKFTALMAITGLGVSALCLTGCAGDSSEGTDRKLFGAEQAYSIQEDTDEQSAPESGVVDTPSEEEQPAEEYKMDKDYTHYQESIDNWLSQDVETLKEWSKDLTKRAEVLAAWYVKYSVEDLEGVLSNSYITVSAAGYNESNPVLSGKDMREIKPGPLDSLIAAPEMIPVSEAVYAKERGATYDEMKEVVKKVHLAVYGDREATGEEFGFGSIATDLQLWLLSGSRLDDIPRRPWTETRILSEEERSLFEERHVVPDTGGYEVVVTETTIKETLETNETIQPKFNKVVRYSALVPLKKGENVIPDYDGNYPGYEWEEPGTPLSKGHPTPVFKVPVPILNYPVANKGN